MKIIDKFKVIKMIGLESFGFFFEAMNTIDKRYCAIKMILLRGNN